MKHKIEIDFDKGIIYRLFKNNVKKEVGFRNEDGYMSFTLNGKNVSNHRFIYEQFHNIKLKSEEHINHKNHIRNDNRITNLEVVSHQQNMQYQGCTTSNTGYKNIYYRKDKNKYQVLFSFNNKSKHFGYFHTLSEAIIRRNQVIKTLNEEFNYKFTIIDEDETDILYNSFFIDL